ncbi:MAG: hypothetical protein KDK51_05845 [Deltaproteobacteria bacterium]|nr:hypothetical protein [Deltaproteobacteria bacterium]
MCKKTVIIGLILWSVAPLVLADTMECESRNSRQQEGDAYLYEGGATVEYKTEDLLFVVEREDGDFGCPYFVYQRNDNRDLQDDNQLIYGGISQENEIMQCGYTTEYYGHGETHQTAGDMEYLCPLVKMNP